MIKDFFQYEFLQNAFWASLLSAIICGVIGVIISQKKLFMMAGGIAHTSYGGVGLGFLLGIEPMITATAFSVIFALIIGRVRKKGGRNSDIIIALLWSLGMALGVVFTSLLKGYPPDINAYLFGNILAVKKSDILIMALFCLIILIAFFMLYNYIISFLFDETFALVSGINPVFFENLILILIALSIILLIRVVGIILVMALLSAPSATASLICKNIKGQIILSSVFSFFFCLIGLLISYNFSVSSGAVIVFVAVISYLISLLLNKIINRKNR